MSESIESFIHCTDLFKMLNHSVKTRWVCFMNFVRNEFRWWNRTTVNIVSKKVSNLMLTNCLLNYVFAMVIIIKTVHLLCYLTIWYVINKLNSFEHLPSCFFREFMCAVKLVCFDVECNIIRISLSRFDASLVIFFTQF